MFNRSLIEGFQQDTHSFPSVQTCNEAHSASVIVAGRCKTFVASLNFIGFISLRFEIICKVKAVYHHNTRLYKKDMIYFSTIPGFTLMGNPANNHARRAASLDSWFVLPLMGMKVFISASVIFRSLPFQHFTSGTCSTTFNP